MKPLLVNAKQIHELLGITVKTVRGTSDFPKPVNGDAFVYRNLWKLKDIEKFVKKLGYK